MRTQAGERKFRGVSGDQVVIFVFVATLVIGSYNLGKEICTHGVVHAQAAATPFVLEVAIYAYSDNPDGELFSEQTTARQSDGSTMLESSAGPVGSGIKGRKVSFADGRSVSVIDALKIKTTWPSPTADVLANRMRALSKLASTCVAKNETAIGHSELWNQNVIIVSNAPDPFPQRLTEWRAPTLGCQALEYQLEKRQPDGSWKLTTRSKIVSLTLGEPDARYFAVPPAYVETKPSDMHILLLKSVGGQVDEAAIRAASSADDDVYAGKKKSK